MTDLENFLETPGRSDQVKEVRKMIDAQGIEYIYFQFASVTGRIMGKGAPAKHWESMAQKGFQLVYGATANLFVDRHGEYIGYGPESRELVGLPDAETFSQLPWDPKVARVFCTLFRGREEAVDPGAFLTSDCRGLLKRTQAAFEAETGMHLRAGTEPEMMWLKNNPDGTPSVEGLSKPYCYHIDQFSEFQPLIHKVMEYAEKLGLDMIQGDHEDAPGQLELNFNFDRAEVTADNLTTYRQICKQVGREMDAFPCFMPKPFMGVSANGCHHNFSIWKGDKNVFDAPDPSNPMMPGDIGLWAIGGILKHLGALTAISSPTVNSYRRLWDTGFWAPVFADWGFQNRTTALRIIPGSPKSTRVEYRVAAADANPYLALAAAIGSGLWGIENEVEPGDPAKGNAYEIKRPAKYQLPRTLTEAAERLHRSKAARELFGDAFVDHYAATREWEEREFRKHISDWELERYFEII